MEVRTGELGETHLFACRALDRSALGGFWSEGQWATELADPRRPCLGLWQQDSLVAAACGWLIVDELHITLVAVDPAQRRRGLGRRVLEVLLGRAQALGAERATLEVAADNAAAVGLYGSLGFHTAGRRCHYYRDGRDALIQWRQLGPRAV
ncbi:GNAT family N-acetyltransferase [Cyanobium sp. ATX 6F1]|uniref:GNAT family N-acetyltransferase n=1 Tax=unclassified Cyanobium TaxID=2627006 RepID=UPI0020CB9FF6|nr:GNAT family N-acetyltransferase [Cyanobium sp. ATX 6F1]